MEKLIKHAAHLGPIPLKDSNVSRTSSIGFKRKNSMLVSPYPNKNNS